MSIFFNFGCVRYFLLVLTLCIPALTFAESVRIPRSAGEEQRLHYRLLTEALMRGGVYSPVYPFGDPDALPLSTRIQGMRSKELDVFAAMTSQEYEDEFLAVYIPLYRGMMGMRLGIVKNSNSELFRDVQNLNDLRRFTAGQGKLWTDSKILAANSIPLVEELKYSNLFRMLEAERFDYFPRGIHEPWQEIESHKSLGLVVDKHIMLWYTAPFYFFVNKNNPQLAAHLTEQLLLLIENGTFQEYFEADADVKKALALADINKRKIIRLDNPFLPATTPVDNKALWFDPVAYKSISH